MSDTIKEIVDIPQNFFREGTHFVNRCTKPNRKGASFLSSPVLLSVVLASRADEAYAHPSLGGIHSAILKDLCPTNFGLSFPFFLRLRMLAEYIQICRAVGMGFVVMGFIGYFVKLVRTHLFTLQRIRIAHTRAVILPSLRFATDPHPNPLDRKSTFTNLPHHEAHSLTHTI